MNDNLKELLQKVGLPNITDNTSYNLKYNGVNTLRGDTDDVKIVSKKDVAGIDIIVKDNVKDATVSIPVIIDLIGYEETVYNEFFIGKNSSVTIYAGCAIDHDSCNSPSTHNGIHTFHLEEASTVKYIEKHYGCGEIDTKIINTDTIIDAKSNAKMTIETVQIEGVDNAKRLCKATLLNNSYLVIDEKIMTTGNEKANTSFDIVLLGKKSSVVIDSKSITKDNSTQDFYSTLTGDEECYGYVSCNAIMFDNSKVTSTPIIKANNVNASLSHEASIGKIQEEQLIKLMSLGVNKNEAEDIIIRSFIS